MRLLTNDEVRQALPMAVCVDGLRALFREVTRSAVVSRPRTEVWAMRPEPGAFYECKTMEGCVPYLERHVIRIDSNLVEYGTGSGGPRQEHLPLASGGWTGLLLAFDTRTGELQCAMPDGYLQRMRVGALYALAAERLSLPDADSVALIGSGWQAGAQLLGLACVRRLRSARIFSPDPEHRRALASEMRDALGIDVQAVDDARTAVRGARIVSLATNARQPVMEAAWAEPGQHVNSVSDRELDPAFYTTADRVVVNLGQHWMTHYPVGGRLPELVDRAQEQRPVPPPDRAVESAEVFAGLASRHNPQEVTVFTNEASNFELGAQFAAVTALVCDRAREAGLGRELPADWWCQHLHP